MFLDCGLANGCRQTDPVPQTSTHRDALACELSFKLDLVAPHAWSSLATVSRCKHPTLFIDIFIKWLGEALLLYRTAVRPLALPVHIN
jgi:hypothetical protein